MMVFMYLYDIVRGKTDIDVVINGELVQKIKQGTPQIEIPLRIRHSYIDYLTAVDYRTIEVGLKEKL